MNPTTIMICTVEDSLLKFNLPEGVEMDMLVNGIKMYIQMGSENGYGLIGYYCCDPFTEAIEIEKSLELWWVLSWRNRN